MKRREKGWAFTCIYRKNWSLTFEKKEWNWSINTCHTLALYAYDKLIINTDGMEISKLTKSLQNHYDDVNI